MSPAPAELALKPLKLADVDVWFVLADDGASDNYKAHVTGVTLTPATSTTTDKTLSPNGVYTSVGAPTWTAALDYLQDWDTAGSLALYLFENQGVAADLFFVPRSGGPGFRVAISGLVSGAIGGKGADSTGSASVTLGVNGKPARLTAADITALTV